jgi:hypothetical protein
MFDRDSNGFLWFRVRGLLVNEGTGTARVRLDGEAHFVEGGSPLLSPELVVAVPPAVGTPDRQEYLLRPSETCLFEWAYGHTLGEWADAHSNPSPPNPQGASFLTVTVTDYFEHGVIDHIYIETAARPIISLPNVAGQWAVPHDVKDASLGLTVYPTRRIYRAEPRQEVALPWEEIYADWNNGRS